MDLSGYHSPFCDWTGPLKKREKRVKKQSSFEVVKPKVSGEETVCGTYGLETWFNEKSINPYIGIHVVSLY